MRRDITSAWRSTGGFTLIEVLLALGILGFGLLTLAVMQLSALRQGSSGRNTTVADTLARTEMEQIQRMPWASVAPTGWAAPPWINVPGHPQGEIPILVDAPGAVAPEAQQVYDVLWRVTNVAGFTNLRNVDVRITWNEPKRPARMFTLSSIRYDD